MEARTMSTYPQGTDLSPTHSCCRSWPRAGGCYCPHCLAASACRRVALAGWGTPSCPVASRAACTACRDKAARWWLKHGSLVPAPVPSRANLWLPRQVARWRLRPCRSGAVHTPTPCPVNGSFGGTLDASLCRYCFCGPGPALAEDSQTARGPKNLQDVNMGSALCACCAEQPGSGTQAPRCLPL